MDSTYQYQTPSEVNRIQMIATVIGVIGAIALIAGGLTTDPKGKEQFFRSYLFGYTVWIGLPIGCLGLLLLQHLTGGAWGMMIRRVLEAGTRTFLLMIPLFLIIIAGREYIYIWASKPSEVFAPHNVEHKAAYLNTNFFIIRALIYFTFFGGMAFILNKWSKDQDTASDSRVYAKKMSRLSGPGMLFFFLTVSFASFDWVMSMDPYFGSTIFGLIFAIGWALSTLTFVICTMAFFATRKPLRGLIGAPHFHDWGKLMLALVMVWAYFNFSQYMLIWWANLPEETKWYLGRTTGDWKGFGFFLFLFHFALPFFLLLSRDLKRNWKMLVPIALFVFFVRMVDIFWLIGPAPHAMSDTVRVLHSNGPYDFRIDWRDIAALMAFGGIWIAFFIWQLKRRPLLPFNDYRLERAIAHGQHGRLGEMWGDDPIE
jgi:hypothetical protein